MSDIALTDLTPAALNALADRLDAEAAEVRARKLELIRSYLRVLARVAKAAFKRLYCAERSVSDGNGSYPPSVVPHDRTGPRVITIRDAEYSRIPESAGFYYTWKAGTEDGGLHVDASGTFYRGACRGSGRFGQFPAHPGDTDVVVDWTWRVVSTSELDDDEIAEVELELRGRLARVSARKAADAAQVVAS